MKSNKRPSRGRPSLWLLPLAAALALPASAQPAAKPAKAPTSALKSNARVTLNFVNADIEAVSRAMAAMTERQIIVDPRVKGTITVYSEQPLTVREAWLNYLAALRGLGFTVVENAGLLKVVPEADAKLQAGTVLVGEGSYRGDQILTQIYRLNHENPNNLVAILRPLISPNNTINANPGNNSLVITDYADNLTRIGKIIAALDMPTASDIDIVPLKHGVAADLAPIVQRLADGTGASTVPGVPTAAGGGVAVIADSRSNALIVRASNAARQAHVRSIIDKLDRPNQSGGPAGNVWVVHLKNADATKMAQVLRAAFGGGGGSGGSPTPAVPTTATGLPGTPGGAGIAAAAAAPVQAGAGPSTGGFIQADPSTNSLIITAAEPLYRQVRSMIEQLDSRRAQLYIESLIVEVSGDDAADFGFQWQGISGRRGDANIVAGGTSFDTTSGSNIIDLSVAAAGGRTTAGTALQSLPPGFNIGVLKNLGNGLYGLSAVARALQSRTNTNIVSTPNIITLDNEEAKIIVGSNVPFITGQFTNTGTATTSPFQTIERKDVGITLRIKPQIGEGGTVRLTIFQESSSVSEKVAPGTNNAGPSTDKRSIESTVVVDDGAILVLGGLIEDKFTTNKSKVPLLGDIPVVGHLFRSESRTKSRTNLMVFLRPVVMRTADEANKLSLDRYDLIRSRQQDSQPSPHLLIPLNESPVLPARPASAPK
ncbi:MAG TPA: type II secretion system secretin GspD [Burkholderiaceae bacterium]|nr:type II secretion system secretin GspD [Burkholderiaceae bacterium]